MPEFNANAWLYIMLIYTALCCVVPMVALGIGAYWAYRHGSSFLNNLITPDVDRMQATFQQMRERYPEKTPDELVATIIQRQSLRCGAIGAITGVGGLPTLPITLPIDMVFSYRIQAAMVNFIARAYDHNNFLPKEEEVMASLVVFGNSQLTDSATQAATKAITSLIGDVGSRFVAKLIPLAGALVGFLVNYLTTQATGRLAAEFYSGRASAAGGNLWQRLSRRGRNDDPPTPV